jgi:SAM-dependent methyltransferase
MHRLPARDSTTSNISNSVEADERSCDELGYIDEISEYHISGWMLVNRRGAIAVPLLRVNGNVVAELKLTGARDDASAVHRCQAVGVYLKVARYLSDGHNLVEVVYKSTQEALPNGTRVINFDRDKLAGAHWSKEYANLENLRTRWWQSEYIVRTINKRVCGENIQGLSAGLYRLIKRQFADTLPARRGVSVGAGFGEKEMDAIEAGLATYFDLFEVSETAVQRGRVLAKERGLEQKISFHLADAFDLVSGTHIYDMVFWNNALHHMPDTRKAVAWSHRVLKPGGLFVMDDYAGATRMQFPEVMLRVSTEFRSTLPERYLKNPYDPTKMMDVKCVPPDEDDLFAMDPSECADSANIIPAIRDIFPKAQIILTGGGVYHLGLSDILHNINEEDDRLILDRAMEFDERCLEMGLTQYAVAYCQK